MNTKQDLRRSQNDAANATSVRYQTLLDRYGAGLADTHSNASIFQLYGNNSEVLELCTPITGTVR